MKKSFCFFIATVCICVLSVASVSVKKVDTVKIADLSGNRNQLQRLGEPKIIQNKQLMKNLKKGLFTPQIPFVLNGSRLTRNSAAYAKELLEPYKPGETDFLSLEMAPALASFPPEIHAHIPDLTKTPRSMRFFGKTLPVRNSVKSIQKTSGAGSISGKVTNETGEGIGGIQVDICDFDLNVLYSVQSDNQGNYNATGIADGVYRVYFNPKDYYVGEWNGDYYFANYSNSSFVIVVKGGNTVADINASLIKGGKISGKIVDSYKNGVENVLVRAMYAQTYTKADGTYVLEGVYPGENNISLVTNNVSYYMDDSQSLEPITVLPENDYSVPDVSLQKAGGIKGKCIYDDGSPINNVLVYLFPIDGGNIKSLYTNENGAFYFKDLQNEKYKLVFLRNSSMAEVNVLTQYYGWVDQDGKDPIAVTIDSVVDIGNIQLEKGAVIKGRVTDEDGNPICNVEAELHLTYGLYYTSTDANGDYTVTGIEPGEYKLGFYPLAAGNYVFEWYGDVTDREDSPTITITEKEIKEGYNIVLDNGGTISGKITALTSGQEIEKARMTAIIDSHAEPYNYSNNSGFYKIWGIPGPNLKLSCNPLKGNYLLEYYNNKISEETADVISIQKNQHIENINFQLEDGGSISGQVKNSDGQGISRVSVYVYDEGDVWVKGAMYATGNDGNYCIDGLKSGNYKIRFFTFNLPDYLSEYYNDKSSLTEADLVSVTQGVETQGIDAKLEKAGSISGTVYDYNGLPVNGVIVRALGDNDIDIISTAITDLNGEYLLVGLPNRYVKVYFRSKHFNSGKFYNEKNEYYDADDILINFNEVIPKIDCHMSKGGVIQGKLLNKDNEGVSNVRLFVFNSKGYWINNDDFWMFTNSNGSFKVEGLPQDNYTIFFSMEYTGKNYVSQWYGGVQEADAEKIHVFKENITVLNNIIVRDGYSLSGKIIGEDNKEIGSPSYLVLYDLNGEAIVGGVAEENGNFKITRIPDCEDYKLYVWPWQGMYQTNYRPSYYDKKYNIDDADIISVDEGDNFVGVTLELGGGITGYVKDEKGIPIEGVRIYVYANNVSHSFYRQTVTDEKGYYEIIGIEDEGEFRVLGVGGQIGPYGNNWYGDADDFDDATSVNVKFGEEVSNVNITLPITAAISGTIIGDDGQPVAWCFVKVYDKKHNYITGTYSNYDGSYMVGGISPDKEIKVFFDGGRGGYTDIWYSNKTSFEDADLIHLTQGVVFENVGAVLLKGGKIYGEVRRFDGSDVTNVRVIAYDLYQHELGSGRVYNNTFFIEGLPEGDCKLHYVPDRGINLLNAWYKNEDDFSDADSVSVTLGETESVDTVVLKEGGKVTLHLVDESNNPINDCLIFYKQVNQNYMVGFDTNENGNVTFSGLKSGEYIFCVNKYREVNYMSEYYYRKSSEENADRVVVQEGDSKTIDWDLKAGGGIIGSVVDENGNEIENANIYIYEDNSDIYQYCRSDNKGKFICRGLSTGNYKLRVNVSYGTSFLEQWYSNQDSQSTATLIEVIKNNDSEVLITLKHGGGISGKITDLSGNPVSSIKVCLYNSYGTIYLDKYSLTDSGGNYSIKGIQDNSYTLYFDNYYNKRFFSKWYNNSDGDDKKQIVVENNEQVTDINAILAYAGVISGHLINGNGEPINGVCGIAYNLDGSWAGSGSVSDYSGYYYIGGLQGGNYKIFFRTNGESSYAGQWYKNSDVFSSAKIVNVKIGGETTDINMEMTNGHFIEGYVSNSSGDGIENVYVHCTNQDGVWEKTGLTNSSGYYKLNGLSNGAYTLKYSADYTDGYVDEYYDNKTTQEDADIITISNADISNVNAVLTEGGTITGEITDENNVPLENIPVYVYDSNRKWIQKSNIKSNSNGIYVILGLNDGNYYVSAGSNSTLDYISEYYKDKLSIFNADLVNVSSGSTTGNIDFKLAKSAEISGYVRNVDGEGIPGICVKIQHIEERQVRTTFTNPDGYYCKKGLPEGNYIIMFESNGNNYAGEYYNNKDSFENADKIYISKGEQVENINAVLDIGGSISGRISDINGNSIGGIQVKCFLNGVLDPPSTTTVSDSDGNYFLVGLNNGNYKIFFDANVMGYTSKYYNDKYTYQEADLVKVVEGSNIPNVNTVLTKGGTISGEVKNKENEGIQGIKVYVYSVDQNGSYVGITDKSGDYKISGILPGKVKMLFKSNRNYISEWYPDALNEEDARELTVYHDGSFSTNPIVNVVLKDGCSIKGRISNGNGEGLFSVVVKVFDQENNLVGETISGWPDGDYLIGGLYESSFKLYFDTQRYSVVREYTSEWFDHQSNFESGTPINTQTGETTSGIDAILSIGASISGTVLDEYNNCLPEAFVTLYNHENNALKSLFTDSNGFYKFSALDEGDYKIRFSSSYYLSNYFKSEYYDSKAGINDADLIVLDKGEQINNVNATLKIDPENENIVRYNIPHIASDDNWSTFLVFDNLAWYPNSATVFIQSNDEENSYKIITPNTQAYSQNVVELTGGDSGFVICEYGTIYYNNPSLLDIKEVFFHETDKGIAEFTLGDTTSNELTFTMPQYAGNLLTWMGMALYNPNGETANVNMTAIDNIGEVLESTALTLTPKSRDAQVLTHLFPETDFRDVARIEASSDLPVAGLNISGYNNEKLLFTKAHTGAASGTLYMSHIATEITQWDNKLIFDNKGNDSVVATIKFYKDGAMLDEIPVDVLGQTTTVIDINAHFDGLEMPTCGEVYLDSTSVVVRQAYENKSQGGVAEFTLSPETAIKLAFNMPAYIVDEMTWMGLAIMNTTDEDQEVQLEAYYSGDVVKQIALTIPAHDRAVGTVEMLLEDLDYHLVDRIIVTGSGGLCGINISGHDQSRLLFSPAVVLQE